MFVARRRWRGRSGRDGCRPARRNRYRPTVWLRFHRPAPSLSLKTFTPRSSVEAPVNAFCPVTSGYRRRRTPPCLDWRSRSPREASTPGPLRFDRTDVAFWPPSVIQAAVRPWITPCGAEPSPMHRQSNGFSDRRSLAPWRCAVYRSCRPVPARRHAAVTRPAAVRFLCWLSPRGGSGAGRRRPCAANVSAATANKVKRMRVSSLHIYPLRRPVQIAPATSDSSLAASPARPGFRLDQIGPPPPRRGFDLSDDYQHRHRQWRDPLERGHGPSRPAPVEQTRQPATSVIILSLASFQAARRSRCRARSASTRRSGRSRGDLPPVLRLPDCGARPSPSPPLRDALFRRFEPCTHSTTRFSRMSARRARPDPRSARARAGHSISLETKPSGLRPASPSGA